MKSEDGIRKSGRWSENGRAPVPVENLFGKCMEMAIDLKLTSRIKL
ncbi:hypothetical protein [Anaerolentibacter hominis]